MKKLISYFTILLSILILGNVKNVLAAEIVSDDIPNSTYIIGKCMFTREVSSSYNGSLSTDVIMLAAKTIDSNRLEDMIIYYKNARGVWVNALTNQKVNIGEKINVEYKNNEIYLMTPTLINSSLTACGTSDCEFVSELKDGKYRYDLSIKNQNVSFTGYEIYEKNGEAYTKVGEGKVHNPEVIEVTIEPGEKKIYVARIYAEKTNGEKVYSEYSNELVIDHSVVETPSLINSSLTACGTSDCEFVPELKDGKYRYDLSIKNQNVSFTGYEIYEKNGEAYTKVGEGKVHNPEVIEVTIEPGEKKIYVARIYAEKTNGEKVYSEYSNELVIDHSVVETPSLINSSLTACGTSDCEFVPELKDGKYRYDLSIKNQNVSFTGYEIYEKNGEAYTKVGEGKVHNPEVIEVTIEPGEKKIYVARIYAEKTNGEKVYSEYSNELVIDHSVVETPSLINSSLTACGTSDCEFVPELKDGKYRYDLSIKNQNVSFTGYEIYEKNGEAYTKVGEGKVHNPEVIEVTIEPGEKKIYVARIYAEKTNGEKVYSEYSNELVIDHSVIDTPTLSNPLGVDAETLKAQLTIGYEGMYAIVKKEQAITGYELYEKVGSELKLIGTSEGLSAIEVTVNSGEKRTFIARVYALNSKNEKVYSAYSNELILEKK